MILGRRFRRLHAAPHSDRSPDTVRTNERAGVCRSDLRVASRKSFLLLQLTRRSNSGASQQAAAPLRLRPLSLLQADLRVSGPHSDPLLRRRFRQRRVERLTRVADGEPSQRGSSAPGGATGGVAVSQSRQDGGGDASPSSPAERLKQRLRQPLHLHYRVDAAGVVPGHAFVAD